VALNRTVVSHFFLLPALESKGLDDGKLKFIQ
jgi:hypothetical protein